MESLDTEMLDKLVKLASAGTSGVCVLAIFCVAACLWRITEDKVHLHRSLRHFMTMCVYIAIVSAAAAGVGSYFNYKQVVQLQGKNEALAQNNNLLKTEVNTAQTQVAKLYEGLVAKDTKLAQMQVALQAKDAKNKALTEVDPDHSQVALRSRIATLESERNKLLADNQAAKAEIANLKSQAALWALPLHEPGGPLRSQPASGKRVEEKFTPAAGGKIDK